MKTETTLRTARNSLLCFFMALGAGFLVACGGGGGGGGVSSSNGTFHASDWVVGLDYTLDNGQTGKTGARGAFSFEEGQTVAFSIGQVTLGNFVSNAGEDFVTPTRIDGAMDAIDVERLLIALDSGSGGNGTIVLDENSATDAVAVTTALGGSSASIALTEGVTVARGIPARSVAQGLLENTNNCAFSGAFEGTWEQPNGGSKGETALVLLAFNEGQLSQLTTRISAERDVSMSLNHIVSDDRPSGALYFNLWKEGGGPETNVIDFGIDAGALEIGLSGFPVVRTITTSDGATITLTVESYERMTYTSAEEKGEYRRVANGDIRDADYRIVGFYSDEDNDEDPAEAEIGIFAFSANKGGGRVRPYVGWFSSPTDGDSSDFSSVYSNIGEGGLSDFLDYEGTPEDLADGDDVGGMKFTEADESSFTVPARDFTGQGDGFGTYTYLDTSDGEVEALVGGWCAL